MSNPIAAIAGSRWAAVRRVPDVGGSSPVSETWAPSERGKNSYQAENAARLRSTSNGSVSPALTSSRTGRASARATTLAATASCPSRNTVATTGTVSSTAALAGQRAQSTDGWMSVTGIRPIIGFEPTQVGARGYLGRVPGVRALRRFTVRAALPDALAQLGDIVMNLRWSWHPESMDLFEAVDPATWTAVGHDPLRLLGEVDPERLAELAGDRRFLRRLADAYDDLQHYLGQPRWYQSLPDVPSSIAYFSPEFGIAEVLPQYSGGLGILAGDHLKAASDLGVPIIGVGLLYRRGYFRQSLSPDGWQQAWYPPLDPNGLPLTLLRDADGQPVRVSVGLPGDHGLRAQIWVAQVGRVP